MVETNEKIPCYSNVGLINNNIVFKWKFFLESLVLVLKHQYSDLLFVKISDISSNSNKTAVFTNSKPFNIIKVFLILSKANDYLVLSLY